jgi:Spy/CpxP family protein refolding chaperone
MVQREYFKMTDPTATRTPRRRWLIGVALIGAFAAGGLTLPVIGAQAQDAAMSGMMGGQGHGAMQGAMMAHIAQMLDKVGATSEQKSRIAAILHDGFASMGAMHADMQATHARLHQLITAPVIDRRALEALRASQVASLDQASRKLVDAMADAAEVLTPAQRAKLATLIPTTPQS